MVLSECASVVPPDVLVHPVQAKRAVAVIAAIDVYFMEGKLPNEVAERRAQQKGNNDE